METAQYEFKKPYPVKPVKPLLKADAKSADYRKYADQLAIYEHKMIVFEQEVEKWKLAKEALMMKFKQDLFITLGIESHPKREKLWDKAWEDGRDEGLYHVYIVASELVELMSI